MRGKSLPIDRFPRVLFTHRPTATRITTHQPVCMQKKQNDAKHCQLSLVDLLFLINSATQAKVIASPRLDGGRRHPDCTSSAVAPFRGPEERTQRVSDVIMSTGQRRDHVQIRNRHTEGSPIYKGKPPPSAECAQIKKSNNSSPPQNPGMSQRRTASVSLCSYRTNFLSYGARLASFPQHPSPSV